MPTSNLNALRIKLRLGPANFLRESPLWWGITLILAILLKDIRHPPVMDHRLNRRADFGGVDCQVPAIEPNKTLS